jgi:hypothetical protein
VLTADTVAGALRWQPFLTGDLDQDGRVGLVLDGAGEQGDWTLLALHWGEQGFAPDSPADLADRAWDPAWQAFAGDGVVDALDAAALCAALGTQLDGWQVYYAPSLAAYPQGGSLAAEVAYSAAQPAASPGGRVSFAWQPAGDLAPGVYWLRPTLGASTGAATLPLAVE